ncbi:LysR family transcriptional regulator [Streptomyces fructofermentans]|uniref:LysR family transcriptional regulator n=1 Tax=Streptomyces fructofermentans TaxID=152141 RepID=A0A918U1V6_9ACTN|nr:LysR family transcriptional regulator [Streptomyces fructofermentans]GGX82540.1 LysR family transcriptional regulator [Streptomyces fructofermentans]
MDTRLLQTFTALARTGSFTATAVELRLAQSTVTVQIKTLEKALGTRLFDRLSRGALLTEAGRRLLTLAEDVLESESRLFAAATEGGPVAGTVVVGAGETLCSAHMPAVIVALRSLHPEVEVRLEPGGTAAVVDGLQTGRLDCALLLEERVEFPDVTAQRVTELPLVLLCAPTHRLAGRDRPATWQELAEEDFFLHEQGCSYSDRLAEHLLSVPGARPRLTRFGSIEATRSCVAAGLGLTVLPHTNVAESLRTGHLNAVPGPSLPGVSVHLARHSRRLPSRAARAVADQVLSHFHT